MTERESAACGCVGADTDERTRTLVVVEDDGVEIQAIRRSVRRAGLDWTIRVFRNGADALAGLRGEHPDGPIPSPFVVLLDLNMPRMNGIELLRVVRADPDLANTNVFVLTTSDDARDVEAATALGIHAYFTKAAAGADYADALTAVKKHFEERD